MIVTYTNLKHIPLVDVPRCEQCNRLFVSNGCSPKYVASHQIKDELMTHNFCARHTLEWLIDNSEINQIKKDNKIEYKYNDEYIGNVKDTAFYIIHNYINLVNENEVLSPLSKQELDKMDYFLTQRYDLCVNRDTIDMIVKRVVKDLKKEGRDCSK